jgi:hypothetical protein
MRAEDLRERMARLRVALEPHGLNAPSLRRLEESPEGVFVLTVTADQAETRWRRLRAVVDETGYWPVLLGSDEDLDLHRENLEIAQDAGEESEAGRILHAAKLFDPAQWVERQLRGGVDDGPGAWPDAPSSADGATDGAFSIPRSAAALDSWAVIHIAMAPTRSSWEVPAYLRFGGFNDCPHPYEHVALWRYWHARYGAEIVGITPDVVEGLTARPPRDRDGALRLAREQHAYCSDIVSQGCGSVSVLASLLVDRPHWFFWWD